MADTDTSHWKKNNINSWYSEEHFFLFIRKKLSPWYGAQAETVLLSVNTSAWVLTCCEAGAPGLSCCDSQSSSLHIGFDFPFLVVQNPLTAFWTSFWLENLSKPWRGTSMHIMKLPLALGLLSDLLTPPLKIDQPWSRLGWRRKCRSGPSSIGELCVFSAYPF